MFYRSLLKGPLNDISGSFMTSFEKILYKDAVFFRAIDAHGVIHLFMFLNMTFLNNRFQPLTSCITA